MKRSAGDVSESTQAIAAISEENSAAAEEVLAASEEMSAQVQFVVESATSLAEMACRLDALVDRFRIVGETSAPTGLGAVTGTAAKGRTPQPARSRAA
jgi:methyl-accepting chemotaxis protein